MPCYRFFSEDSLAHHHILIQDDENHHLQHVMRVQEGEEVEVVDGKGVLAKAFVKKLTKKETTLEILSRETTSPPSHSISLVLPILRAAHLDIAIEKGVEIGVDHFILFKADKAEKKDFPESLKRRLTSITKSALKQSGRLFLPSISFEPSLSFLQGKPYLWADLHPQGQPALQALQEMKESSLFLCIGPEAGWSEREKEFLLTGRLPVILHENILRAETAAIVFSYLASLHLASLHRIRVN